MVDVVKGEELDRLEELYKEATAGLYAAIKSRYSCRRALEAAEQLVIECQLKCDNLATWMDKARVAQ